jgi:hypothetical protein
MYRKGLNLQGMWKIRADKFFASPEKIAIRDCRLLLVSLSVFPDGAAWLPLKAVLLNLILLLKYVRHIQHWLKSDT